MATFAIGDIHGNLPALDDLLDQVLREAADGDTVVFLGDYIDRGPNSRECIEAILGFRRTTKAKVVCLLGNHEDWLLRSFHDHSRHSWLLGMEAFDTIRSYSVAAAEALTEAVSNAGPGLYLGDRALPYDVFFDSVPADHIRFFENLSVCHRNADGFYSHGGLDPGIEGFHGQRREALIWGAGSFPDTYRGAETVVYGHHNNATLTSSGWPTPTLVGRTIGIDTISHGVLTAVRLPDQRVFQSVRTLSGREQLGQSERQ
jgi:serine/threonine protein phosphatase 1